MEILPDCVLRGLAVGLNHSYIDLCKIFGISYRLGKGMVRKHGATIDRIIKVCSDQGFIKAHEVDGIFEKIFDKNNTSVFMGNDNRFYDKTDSLIDVEDGLSVAEYAAMLPSGRYFLFLRPTTKARLIGDNVWHLTCYDKDENALYDTFNCTKDTVVFGFAQVNPGAILSDSDELSRTSELKKVMAGKLWGNVIPPGFTPETWNEKIKTNTLNPNFLAAIWKWRLRKHGIIS